MGTQLPLERGHSSPHFSAHVYSIVAKRSPISATADHLYPSTVSRVRLSVSVRIMVRFSFRDSVGIRLPDVD